jgi:acyl-CoA thioesterase FadM
MPLTDFRCVLRFRVPFSDVDMMQHVNHAAYVVWAETARWGLANPIEVARGGQITDLDTFVGFN